MLKLFSVSTFGQLCLMIKWLLVCSWHTSVSEKGVNYLIIFPFLPKKIRKTTTAGSLEVWDIQFQKQLHNWTTRWMAEVIHSLPGRQSYLQVQLMQEIKAGGGPINFVLKSGFFFFAAGNPTGHLSQVQSSRGSAFQDSILIRIFCDNKIHRSSQTSCLAQGHKGEHSNTWTH